MNTASTDRIERKIVPGERFTGKVIHPEYEHLEMAVTIQKKHVETA